MAEYQPITIVKAESAGQFVGYAHSRERERLLANIQQYCNSLPATSLRLADVREEEVMLGKIEGQWNRVRIIEVLQRGAHRCEARCYLVDVGEERMVSLATIRICPAKLRAYDYRAKRFRLDGVQPSEVVINQETTCTTRRPCQVWSLTADRYVEQRLKNSVPRVEVMAETKTECLVRLHLSNTDGTKCLNDELVQCAYAFRLEPALGLQELGKVSSFVANPSSSPSCIGLAARLLSARLSGGVGASAQDGGFSQLSESFLEEEPSMDTGEVEHVQLESGSEEKGDVKVVEGSQHDNVTLTKEEQKFEKDTYIPHKTSLCRYINTRRGCHLGDKCCFAHGSHELKRLEEHPDYKSVTCKFRLGLCPFGDGCYFRHDSPTKQQCRYAAGKCPRGEGCRYVHDWKLGELDEANTPKEENVSDKTATTEPGDTEWKPHGTSSPRRPPSRLETIQALLRPSKTPESVNPAPTRCEMSVAVANATGRPNQAAHLERSPDSAFSTVDSSRRTPVPDAGTGESTESSLADSVASPPQISSLGRTRLQAPVPVYPQLKYTSQSTSHSGSSTTQVATQPLGLNSVGQLPLGSQQMGLLPNSALGSPLPQQQQAMMPGMMQMMQMLAMQQQQLQMMQAQLLQQQQASPMVDQSNTLLTTSTQQQIPQQAQLQSVPVAQKSSHGSRESNMSPEKNATDISKIHSSPSRFRLPRTTPKCITLSTKRTPEVATETDHHKTSEESWQRKTGKPPSPKVEVEAIVVSDDSIIYDSDGPPPLIRDEEEEEGGGAGDLGEDHELTRLLHAKITFSGKSSSSDENGKIPTIPRPKELSPTNRDGSGDFLDSSSNYSMESISPRGRGRPRNAGSPFESSPRPGEGRKWAQPSSPPRVGRHSPALAPSTGRGRSLLDKLKKMSASPMSDDFRTISPMQEPEMTVPVKRLSTDQVEYFKSLTPSPGKRASDGSPDSKPSSSPETRVKRRPEAGTKETDKLTPRARLPGTKAEVAPEPRRQTAETAVYETSERTVETRAETKSRLPKFAVQTNPYKSPREDEMLLGAVRALSKKPVHEEPDVPVTGLRMAATLTPPEKDRELLFPDSVQKTPEISIVAPPSEKDCRQYKTTGSRDSLVEIPRSAGSELIRIQGAKKGGVSIDSKQILDAYVRKISPEMKLRETVTPGVLPKSALERMRPPVELPETPRRTAHELAGSSKRSEDDSPKPTMISSLAQLRAHAHKSSSPESNSRSPTQRSPSSTAGGARLPHSPLSPRDSPGRVDVTRSQESPSQPMRSQRIVDGQQVNVRSPRTASINLTPQVKVISEDELVFFRSPTSERPLKSILKMKSDSETESPGASGESPGASGKSPRTPCAPTHAPEFVETDSDDSMHDYEGIQGRQTTSPGRRVVEDFSEPSYVRQLAEQQMLDEQVFSRDRLSVYVDGWAAPPINTIESSRIHDSIKENFNRMEFDDPSPIQAHAWKPILRSRNVSAVAPVRSGKTMAYLVPLMSSLLNPSVYGKLPKDRLDAIVIILTSSFRQTFAIQDQCDCLSLNLGHHDKLVKYLSIYDASDKDSNVVSLINGCKILITTPVCLLRMLEKQYTFLHQLCHLVLDDADILTENFTKEVDAIMKIWGRTEPRPGTPHQILMFGSQWTPGMSSFQRAYMPEAAVVITAPLEAAVYAGVKHYTYIVNNEQRMEKLKELVQARERLRGRPIIFMRDYLEAELVEEMLRHQSINAMACHHAMTSDEQTRVKDEWLTYTTNAPYLVVTDDTLLQMDFKSATCCIHFGLSSNRTRFGKRLSCMRDLYRKMDNEENNNPPQSHIILSENENAQEASNLCRLLTRTGDDPPALLKGMARFYMEGRERGREMVPLCHYLKAYGKCRDQLRCSLRHLMSDIDVDENSDLPYQGEIKLEILRVCNAQRYMARLLELRQYSLSVPGDDLPVGTLRHTKQRLDEKYEELFKTMSEHFETEENRRRLVSPAVHDMCCVWVKEQYRRARIKELLRFDTEAPLETIRVNLIDDALEMNVSLDQVYSLPVQFMENRLRAQPVEIYVARIRPMHGDVDWTGRATKLVHELISGAVLQGRIVLSLGNTLWLDPLVELKYLPEQREYVKRHSVREELIHDEMAQRNEEHMERLYELCRELVNIPDTDVVARLSKMKKEKQISRRVPTETLDPEEQGYRGVNVRWVNNPGDFYVVKQENLHKLDELQAEINRGAGDLPATNDLDGAKVQIGTLCLAKFKDGQDWFRGRVLAKQRRCYDVFFVDWGDRDLVSVRNMRRLPPQYSELPFQAMQCALAGITPIGGSWTDEASDDFLDMTRTVENDEKFMWIQVMSSAPSRDHVQELKYEVRLQDTTGDQDLVISHELERKRHALSTDEYSKDQFNDVDTDAEMNTSEEPNKQIRHLCAMIVKRADSLQQRSLLISEIREIVKSHDKAELLDLGCFKTIASVLHRVADPTAFHALLDVMELLLQTTDYVNYLYEVLEESGGLKAMCRTLSSTPSTMLMTSIARFFIYLQNDERVLAAIAEYGGLQSLIDKLPSLKFDKDIVNFLDAMKHLLVDCAPHCELFAEKRGVKSVSRVLAKNENSEVLDILLEILAILVQTLDNTEVIRRDSALEALCMTAVHSQHGDMVKRCCDLLLTLCGHAKANVTTILAEGLVGKLRKRLKNSGQVLENDVMSSCSELLTFLNKDREDNDRLAAKRSENLVPILVETGGDEVWPLAESVKTVRPDVLWSQGRRRVILKILLHDVRKMVLDCQARLFHFRTYQNECFYVLDFELFGEIKPERTCHLVKSSCVLVALYKLGDTPGPWKKPYKGPRMQAIKLDPERFRDSSDECSDEDDCIDPNRIFAFRPKPPTCFSTINQKAGNTAAASPGETGSPGLDPAPPVGASGRRDSPSPTSSDHTDDESYIKSTKPWLTDDNFHITSSR